MTRAEWDEVRMHAEQHICLACRYELDRLGPVHGPERAPVIRDVSRWSMTKAEWAGGWL